jgi:transcription elongation GreA/GreB family factor
MSAETADAQNQQEMQFLEALEARPIPVDTLVGVLRFLLSSGQAATAENWTDMLQEALVEAADRDGLVRLLRFRAANRESDRDFGGICRDLLRKAWKDRDGAAYLETAGLGNGVPADEALRRLEWLLACRPGALCLDRTWGCGVIRRADPFYRKFTIDFPGRPGHQVSFSHAAEALAPVDASHLLARQHADPASLARLAAERPDEVVRLALRSFGALSVSRLEEVLAEHKIVPAADWKRFWEGARKALKADPCVEIPAKRSEPVRLLAQARDYGPAWLAAFARERDLPAIAAGVEAFFDAAGGQPADDARGILRDRLAFAIKGAHNTDAALYARLAALSSRTGIETVPAAEMRGHLWEQDRFLHAAEKLSARDVERLVHVLAADPEAPARLLAALPFATYSLLNEILAALRETPSLVAAQARCRELLLAPEAPPALIVWVFRNRATLAGWPLPGLPELLAHAILLVEKSVSGEALRMQNQMRLMFENARWFEDVLEELDTAGRQALFDRLHASTAWDPATQRTLLARLMKAVPGLAARGAAAAGPAAPPPAAPRRTSWRSLRERQAAYKRLVEVEMPANSRDIATARSYGDLRENFEYHAAKQQQALLLQRQAEMDLELRQVQGFDFAGIVPVAAGPGARVTIAHADGRMQRFCILGEWDRDEALGIISCQSRMAQCLEGHRTGETVAVPGETGDEPVTIAAVEPLDDAIHSWLGSSPEPVESQPPAAQHIEHPKPPSSSP